MYFVETGVHPSRDNNCKHQIIRGMLKITLPSPTPYKRTVWDYEKQTYLPANACLVISFGRINSMGLDQREKANSLKNNLLSILSKNSP